MSSDSGTAREHADKPIERISDGFLAFDTDWRVTYLNSAAEELLDVDRSEVVDTAFETALPDVADSTFGRRIEEAIQTGAEVTFEEYCEPLSSWLEGTAYPSDEGVSVFVRNVTERERLRQERAERKSALERLNDIASDLELTNEEKIEGILEVGVNRLDTSYGYLTRIDDGTQEIVQSVGDHPAIQPGSTAPLSEAYCRYTIEADEPVTISNAPEEGWENDPAYERFGLDCYLGAKLFVDGEKYGTVCFADTDPRQTPFDEHERTFVELLTDWIHHLLEQQVYERELEHQQAFTESLMNSLPDPLYAIDDDGEFIRWNERLETVTGYGSDELESMHPADLVIEDDRDRVSEAIASACTGSSLSIETHIETRSGETIPYELSGAPLRDETGEIVGVTGIGRDITELKAYQKRLSRILDATRSLMQARDRTHVGELAANAACELLDEKLSVFHLYDGDEECLDPITTTDDVAELMGPRPIYGIGEGIPGEVFASGEAWVIDDIERVDPNHEYGVARSVVCYPVGVHGTITVASTEPNAFDETDQQVLALLATSAAAACMRAKRMREIREARKHTERVLDRVNGLIQNTVEVLVQATTREELEDGVVTELAAADPYSFAWIGKPDVTTERLLPTAWDGDVSLPIEGRSFDLRRRDEPVSRAFTDRATQVRTDLAEEGPDPWPNILADSNVDALVTIPLVYKDTNYGVLAVCAEDGDVFDERERVVLEALGRAVANAINAVERGRILDATEIIELEFAVSDHELLFSRLSAGANCRLEATGTDIRSDGRVRQYLTAEDVDPQELLDLARQDPDVIEVTCIVEHDRECLLEIVVEESLLSMLTEYGAVPREVIAKEGTTRFIVELPYEAEARELFELVEDRYPGTDLLGYHERERAVETRQDFKAALGNRLTDRQETALRTAYLGGFFDWPREVDGNELAEAMDISRPTYHQHLRAAQAKVFEELFE